MKKIDFVTPQLKKRRIFSFTKNQWKKPGVIPTYISRRGQICNIQLYLMYIPFFWLSEYKVNLTPTKLIKYPFIQKTPAVSLPLYNVLANKKPIFRRCCDGVARLLRRWIGGSKLPPLHPLHDNRKYASNGNRHHKVTQFYQLNCLSQLLLNNVDKYKDKFVSCELINFTIH